MIADQDIIPFIESMMIAALRLTDMAMEKRNARDMFRPGVDTNA